MIVVDSNVLAYAVGAGHALAEPCRRLVEAITEGRVRATTTVEVIQELVHVRSRRRPRHEATQLGRWSHNLLSPLIVVDEDDLERGLRLFERHTELDSFDAVLAAVALRRETDALVSADRAFANVPRLRYVDPATPALDELLAS